MTAMKLVRQQRYKRDKTSVDNFSIKEWTTLKLQLTIFSDLQYLCTRNLPNSNLRYVVSPRVENALNNSFT